MGDFCVDFDDFDINFVSFMWVHHGTDAEPNSNAVVFDLPLLLYYCPDFCIFSRYGINMC